ncbi:MAG: LOG family protein [Roseibacillus sp.]
MKAVREIDSLNSLLRQKGQLHGAVVQGLDLSKAGVPWSEVECHGAVFLGCNFPEGVGVCDLMERGASVFPAFPDFPYDPYRPSLYSRDELMEGWTPKQDLSLDLRIYERFAERGRKHPHILEALAMRLHDHAIDDALGDLLEGRVEKDGVKKVVGIMGGHSMGRDEEDFKRVARVAWALAKKGYFVATGGGPGVMEAGNLGAYLAGEDEESLEWSLSHLAKAPGYQDEGYAQLALDVIERFPTGTSSLAVPTWFYGHEPTNWFAQHVAKYFSNSLREDGLLAIATHGVIYARGSAGTTQEVFMDACQNHYQTFEVISPMVFLGSDWFGDRTGIFETVSRQAGEKAYGKYVTLVDEVASCVAFIEDHPPALL